MIYTVTLNPSIDYIVQVSDLKLGALNRMDNDLKLPGGKGINVSRVLKRLAIDSTALGFLGGFTGSFIRDWLAKEAILEDFTLVKDDTRINIKLKSTSETEINGQGPAITAAEIQDLKQKLAKLKTEDTVILSGSAPKSLPAGFYLELVKIIKEKNAEFIIDTTGRDLLAALSYRPLVIKPNNHELAELFETNFDSVEAIIPYGKKLLELGAQNVIISMAGAGALLFTQKGCYRAEALKRPVKNSVGAGDSMIAGFVGGYEQTKDPLAAFKTGVACGSATAFSEDLATEAFIKELLPEVNITAY